MPKTKIYARLKKSTDFELHVRTVKDEGLTLIELRDFIPSDKWYGRGVQIEPRQLPELIGALQDLARFLGGSSNPSESDSAQAAAASDPNQGRLF